KADRWQLLHYLFELKKRGLTKKGLISYTKEKRTEEVILSKNDEIKLKEIENNIERVVEQSQPPNVINAPICKKCAYYYFCYAEEEEYLRKDFYIFNNGKMKRKTNTFYFI